MRTDGRDGSRSGPSPLPTTTMHPHLTLLHVTLLGFALWTLAILTFTVGVHRWSRILTGGSKIHEFSADGSEGPDWYRRGVRAHANCVENLPVYGAIVFIASSVGAGGGWVDVLAVTTLCARVVQTLVHVSFVQSQRAVSVRFSFFMVQVVTMVAMVVFVVRV